MYQFLIAITLVMGASLQAASVELNDQTFNKTVSSGVVIVDFYASWCAPCKQFAPTFEKMSEEMKEVVFAKFNVDKGSSADDYQVKSIPTIILFKDGKEVARNIGAMDANTFRRWILNNS